jgi:acetyl-CoA acetyltransferase
MNISRTAAITGIGELKPVLDPKGRTSLDLLREAAALAIKDAGLQKSDIDGLLITPPAEDSCFMWPAQVAEYLNMSPAYINMVELGGASACAALTRAALGVAAGLCSHCLCLSGGIWDSQVFNSGEGKMAVMSRAEIDYELPYGPMGFNSGYALIARRHMHEFGTTPEQMAKIAVDQRQNALANPDALFNQQAMSIAEVLDSPLIVDPIHLLEIVRPCSGAAAVVISPSEAAQDMPGRPVYLLGMGEACTHNSIVYSENITVSPVKYSAARAFAMAGLKPADMDMLSLYDCYPITVIVTLEDAGFCAKGEGGSWVEDRDLTYRGPLPLNTHGGQLSFGQPSYAGGMSHVTEAVRQLRGTAGKRQIKNNGLAFVNGNGGVMSTQSSLILGRD